MDGGNRDPRDIVVHFRVGHVTMSSPKFSIPILSRPSTLHILPPDRLLLLRPTGTDIPAPVQTTCPLLPLTVLILGLLLVPAPIDQQIIQAEAQQGKGIALEIRRVGGAQVDGGSDAADDGDLVGVDQGPGGGEAGVFAALEQPHPRHDEEVVGEGVAELVPPVLADDGGRVDLLVGPQVRVARLVEEDGLEHVVLERHGGRELGLVVGAVEAHFELRRVGRVFLDVVHRLVVGGAVGVAGGLVDAGEGRDGAIRVVEVLVVPLHVGTVGVGDGDVVGEFGGAEDFALAEAAGSGEEALGGVGAAGRMVNDRTGRSIGLAWEDFFLKGQRGAYSTQRMSSSYGSSHSSASPRKGL